MEVVKATLRDLKRIKGTAQRQATPLIKEDLFVVLDAMGSGLRVRHAKRGLTPIFFGVNYTSMQIRLSKQCKRRQRQLGGLHLESSVSCREMRARYQTYRYFATT
jgi:hypothetical protein